MPTITITKITLALWQRRKSSLGFGLKPDNAFALFLLDNVAFSIKSEKEDDEFDGEPCDENQNVSGVKRKRIKTCHPVRSQKDKVSDYKGGDCERTEDNEKQDASGVRRKRKTCQSVCTQKNMVFDYECNDSEITEADDFAGKPCNQKQDVCGVRRKRKTC